jgi:hypothetical protein
LLTGQFENDQKVGRWTRSRKTHPSIRLFTSTYTDEEGVSIDTIYYDGIRPVFTGTRSWGKLEGVWSSYGGDGEIIDEDEWRDGWCVSQCESDEVEDQLREFVW